MHRKAELLENKKFEVVWNEVALAKLEAQSLHFRGRTEEKDEKFDSE
jgi:hypothetical protein